MIVEYRLDEIVMNFAESILQIKQGDDNRPLSDPGFIDDVGHLG